MLIALLYLSRINMNILELEIADNADNSVSLTAYDFSAEMLQKAREKARDNCS